MRSVTSARSPKVPDCSRSLSTNVVLPWSTWAMMAIEIPVLIISANDSPTLATIAAEKGALGFIPKSSEAEVMLEAIQALISGESYLLTPKHTNSEMCERGNGMGRLSFSDTRHLVTRTALGQEWGDVKALEGKTRAEAISILLSPPALKTPPPPKVNTVGLMSIACVCETAQARNKLE
ncbi:hypothetical protein GQR58_023178 [Nymphon striatum]|nr:hypothetical protein GQR58_023178 [Nymphon striatum]